MGFKIMVTGGKGHLAQELLRIDPSIDAPGREELDVREFESIERYCRGKEYDAVVHAAAVTNKFNEDADEAYIRSNIIGTSNIVLWAMRHKVRLVYISSDYVYPSERGEYTEESVLYPVNRYSRSKLGGEMAVQLYDNSLIVRTSFYESLKFPKACTDQYTSRLPIREAAKAIFKLSRDKNLRGIINLGTRRKRSIYEIVRSEFNDSVEPCTRADIGISYILPPDSSLDTEKYYRLESEMKESKKLDRCRMCGSDQLYRYLELGTTPLANSYLTNEQLSSPEFSEELALQLCLKCGLSQLTKVVHPDLMFKNYLYVSSTTQTFRDHCEELAQTSVARAQAQAGDLVLDIASNDGCLLSRFAASGMTVLGVDPAENLAAEANAAGIRTLCTYWSTSVAKDIVSRFGMPKIITATNVFAHVDDVREFVAAVDSCMAPGVIFLIEFPYLVDFIEKNEFDTAYHEHLSYIAIHPVRSLMRAHGLDVFDVEYFKDLHGGTVRVFVGRPKEHPVSERVETFLKREREFGVLTRTPYDAFAKRVLENKLKLRELLNKLHGEGKKIWAYGASAKGNTLMNFFQLGSALFPVVVDDNPKKWKYYAPGSHMRITGIDELPKSNVDYLLLLAWNFQTEIIRRCKAAKYSGEYIVPVPVASVIHSNNE